MEEKELEKEGWKFASITGGAHLERILEMYKELGFEVLMREVSPEECGGCTICFREGGEKIYKVYTRRKEKVEEEII